MKIKIVFTSIIILLIISITYIVLGLFDIVPFPFQDDSDEDFLSSIEEAAKTMTESCPTDIVIYGSEFEIENKLNVRYVDKISKDAFARKSGCEYSAIVINDVYSKMTLSDDEISLVDEMIKTENYCVIYLGKNYEHTWDDPDKSYGQLKGNLFTLRYTINNDRKGYMGGFTEEDLELLDKYPFMLEDAVIYGIEYFLEDVA